MILSLILMNIVGDSDGMCSHVTLITCGLSVSRRSIYTFFDYYYYVDILLHDTISHMCDE